MNFLALLTLIFITLKLMGFIAWSWFWVLSPLIPAFILIVMGFSYIIALISSSFADFFKGRK